MEYADGANIQRSGEETDTEYFIRIAKSYCYHYSSIPEVVGSADENDEEVDGVFGEAPEKIDVTAASGGNGINGTAERVKSDTNGASTDQIDGRIIADGGDLEGKSAALDAILPSGVAPEWYMGKVPLSRSPRENKRGTNKMKLTMFPIGDDLIKKLTEAEEKVLAGISGYLKTFDVKTRDIEIAPGVTVHTVHFWSKLPSKSQMTEPPLVLLHGTGGGVPCFHKVYEELTQVRDVYAIDVPGFGLTSRINFALESDNCEDQFVDILERWRIKIGLDKFILLGHSFGAYVCAIYAINYYKHISNLILLDPWGVLSEEESGKSSQSLLYEAARVFCAKFKVNPSNALSHLGPLIGGVIMNFYMSENAKKSYGAECMEYLKIANTTGEMSGMKALLTLSDFKIEYPVRPLKKRLEDRLRFVKLPLTFIYGMESPYKNCGGEKIQSLADEGLVNVEYVDGSNHHIHAETPQRLIKILNDLLRK